ncbi:hypothetical protein ANTQUA_LOCUS2555 [Anthophora quadrimaculata]
MIPVMERKVYNCCRHTTMTGEESHRTVSMFQGSSAMSRWHHSIDEKTLEISKYPRCIILFSKEDKEEEEEGNCMELEEKDVTREFVRKNRNEHPFEFPTWPIKTIFLDS